MVGERLSQCSNISLRIFCTKFFCIDFSLFSFKSLCNKTFNVFKYVISVLIEM